MIGLNTMESGHFDWFCNGPLLEAIRAVHARTKLKLVDSIVKPHLLSKLVCLVQIVFVVSSD